MMVSITYAKKNGQLVHISEVTQGVSCGCTCVECGNQLLARKGSERIHHFAHLAFTDCLGGTETTLHKIAKELFLEMTAIQIPEYIFQRQKLLKNGLLISHPNTLICKGGLVKIEGVEIESMLASIRPDVVVTSHSKKLIIEIAVTNPVNRQKIRKIRRSNYPAIEIQLDLSDGFLTKDNLKDKLQKDLSSKKWLYHPNQLSEEFKFVKHVRNKLKQSKNTKEIDSIKKHPNLKVYDTSRTVKDNYISTDSLAYEFYLKFKRQPTDDEYKRLYSILYKEPSYYPKK